MTVDRFMAWAEDTDSIHKLLSCQAAARQSQQYGNHQARSQRT